MIAGKSPESKKIRIREVGSMIFIRVGNLWLLSVAKRRTNNRFSHLGASIENRMSMGWEDLKDLPGMSLILFRQ